MIKKKVSAFLLTAIILAAALLYFLPKKTFDELMPLPDGVSITATYWHADNSYVIAEWQAGSPQAEDVLNDLRSTTYSKNPIYALTYRLRRLDSALNGNTGLLTLVMRDEAGNKYLTGVQNGTFNFNLPDSGLSRGWMSANPELGSHLIERVIIAPEN